MPKYANPFAGHMPTGDPRGPLSAAGGCVWPTCPAYRYALMSDDATGDLAFFNTDPVIIEFTSPQPSHDLGFWQLAVLNPYVSFAVGQRSYVRGSDTYNWLFFIGVVAIPEALLTFGIIRDVETCNRNLPLPNTWAYDIDRGVTGDTFRMEQVIWDEDTPPA